MNPESGPERPRQRDWSLTREAFERLLAVLDSDRDRAAEKYEQTRRKLTRLFQWRGCPNPDEYADRTFDRIAMRLTQGSELRVENPYVYFHGVALNILREHWREAGKEVEIGPDAEERLTVHPDELHLQEKSRLESERRLACLERCMERLPVESRQLVANYHGAEKSQIAARKRLADLFGIPLNALRTRACRIRSQLEACVTRCLDREENRQET